MDKRIDSDKFKGIKPISPYQRIAEKYQPFDERPQHGKQKQSNLPIRPTRRFLAMRNLINDLKQEQPIERVDYISAEQEIRAIGLATINNSLPLLLSELGLSNNATKEIYGLVEEQIPYLQLLNRPSISQLDSSIYSNVGQDLQVLNLELPDLALPMIDFSCVILVERCQNGPISSTMGNLFLTINSLDKKTPQGPRQQCFQLTLSITSGVIEFDSTGRRAFVYQRIDKSFGLYADKQINLEI